MFRIETGTRMAGGTEQRVYILSNRDGQVQAEIWPGLGCNCLRWRVPGPTGPLELLYSVPDWESNPIPTRSGNPVLFPFPNRIRDGRFHWDGREYQLPLNGPDGRHAIHGFVCRRPWRVISEKVKDDTAILETEFQASVDAPDALPLWPADYRITVTHRLTKDSLIVQARVVNPDSKPLPYGLGYHPYFSAPFAAGTDSARNLVTVPAGAIWKLDECLPTGERLPVDDALDLRRPRWSHELTLDHVYTDLDPSNGPFQWRGRIDQPRIGAVEVWTTSSFREVVAFTPSHRSAICLEPYTCVTDAINLHTQGLDTGLRVLSPGEKFTGFVEYRWVPYL